jgi:dihydropteroate synthase
MAATLWKIGEQTIDFARGGMIMGVLNVTPDSFSDGTTFFESKRAHQQAMRMIEEGAEIIDVGGESTRPGARAVPEEEELRRVIPVIERMRAANETVLISVDTSKAAVARAAIEARTDIINDVTGGRGDAKMFAVAAERSAGFIIMHMQGTPRTMQERPHYDDVVAEVAEFFRQQYACALECGLNPMAIAFDPGIGFGKTLKHNLELLRNLPRLRIENRPLVVGVSRKSFLGKLIDAREMSERTAPTVALTALLREHGADVLRVHDVKENVAALRAAEAFLGARE